MTADCLLVLFATPPERGRGRAHAGWRGLLAGVLEATVAAMGVPGDALMAWLGPGHRSAGFRGRRRSARSLRRRGCESGRRTKPAAGDKWLADIYLLARQRLAGQGVTRVFGGDLCTVADEERFFSYRRDGGPGAWPRRPG